MKEQKRKQEVCMCVCVCGGGGGVWKVMVVFKVVSMYFKIKSTSSTLHLSDSNISILVARKNWPHQNTIKSHGEKPTRTKRLWKLANTTIVIKKNHNLTCYDKCAFTAVTWNNSWLTWVVSITSSLFLSILYCVHARVLFNTKHIWLTFKELLLDECICICACARMCVCVCVCTRTHFLNSCPFFLF